MSIASGRRPHLLCILDGFGLNPNPKANAIAIASTPHFDAAWNTYPHTTLITHGERVGLPAGQMGNSEVGHLNIGAGRVVEQWLLRVSNAFRRGDLATSSSYLQFLKSLSPTSCIHMVGLWSDGGVHSHSEHMELLLRQLHKDFSGIIALHLISDGRDTSPRRAGEQLEALETLLKSLPRVQVRSLSGRYYAMDRDHRWERTKRAYDVITGVLGAPLAPSLREAIESSYSAGITDEFIDPVRIAPLEGHANGSSNYPPVQEGDGFVFWNFREDRARQIVECLTATNFSGFSRTNDGTTLLSAPFASGRTLCLTEYDSEFLLPVLFPPQHVTHHLGAVVSEAGLTQLRAAETEKYPHVTYFLNGGEESPLPGEERVLVPSPRDVATYDLKPEMSAHAVTDAVVNAINGRQFDLIVVNLANCDMVGHTGVLEAAVRAVEVVDSCLGRILAALTANGGAGVILADHGNAEQMINYATGEPHTAHTTYPVPFIVVEAPVNGLAPTHLGPNGALCDVAPTLLKLMGIRQPPEMSGKALF